MMLGGIEGDPVDDGTQSVANLRDETLGVN
jgi:hypothetical protein